MTKARRKIGRIKRKDDFTSKLPDAQVIESSTDKLHSGIKYHRKIPFVTDQLVDVYSVLVAFKVICPARQHAIKKLLCGGIRGKADTLTDLKEARDSISRAIELEEYRLTNASPT